MPGSAIARARTTRRSLIPRVTGFPGGMDQFGNFRLINAYYDSYSKTTSGNAGIRSRFQIGPVNHAVNLAFTGYYQENGNAYVANTPAQSVMPSNIYNPSPLPVVTGARLPPQKANEITLRSMAIADTMSFLERDGPLHRRCSSPESGTGCLQHHHRSADKQLRSGSGHAACRHCRQAIAECLAVRELRRRT